MSEEVGSCQGCGRDLTSLFFQNNFTDSRFISSNFCEICKKSSNIDDKFIKSEDLSSDSLTRFTCSYCHLVFPNEELIQLHEKNHQYLFNFKCLICEENFQSEDELASHLMQEHSRHLFVCSICMDSFPVAELLNNHFFSHTNLKNEEAFVCEFCGKQLTTYEAYEEHMVTHEAGTIFICNICCGSFKSKDELLNHMNSVHSNDGQLACNVCNITFPTSQLLQQHLAANRCSQLSIKLEKSEVSLFHCDICEATLTSVDEWEVHRASHDTLQCKECQLTFKSLSLLQNHIRATHEEVRETFTCARCGKGLTSKSKLAAHEKSHMNEKPFCCQICGNSYSSKTNMLQHQKVRHSDIKPFVCSICGKSFALGVYYRDHMQGHLGAKTHECDVCHKRFRKKSYMKVHERTHTGAQPFHCEVCNRSFAQKANLLKHAQLHTDKRSHNCTVCKKGFTDTQALKRHMNTHTGHRPYVCSTCGQSYGTKGSLNVHMKFHEEVKPHVCNICHKGFFLKSHLKRHMLTHSRDKHSSKSSAPKISKVKYVSNQLSTPSLKKQELSLIMDSVSDNRLVIDEHEVVIDNNVDFTCIEEVVLV